MATINIKNVGPIKEANLKLNKINIFMGPQSSGKSTIAKLISYCQWVEKRRLLDGEYKEDVEKQLLGFHHLDENYFDDNSCFEYESDFINIHYSGEKLTEIIKVNETNIFDYKKAKNIYIPAERNFVSVIPNLKKYNESNDNILNLIYDWFSTKRKYTQQKSLPILNFDINYYYQENSDLDMLVLNKVKKEISLVTASSGLQSIIPLIVLLDYLTTTIYKDFPVISVKERDNIESLKKTLPTETIDLSAYAKFIYNYRSYHYTNFIIEEPEQNLFPETQRDLIYYILEKLQSGMEHSLTITTHSPYILYALNNCMLGGLVNSQLAGTEKEEFLNNSFLSRKSWINPDFVSVWEIDNGELRQIQDKDNIISQNYFDIKMTELMDEYYSILNFYKDEE